MEQQMILGIERQGCSDVKNNHPMANHLQCIRGNPGEQVGRAVFASSLWPLSVQPITTAMARAPQNTAHTGPAIHHLAVVKLDFCS